MGFDIGGFNFGFGTPSGGFVNTYPSNNPGSVIPIVFDSPDGSGGGSTSGTVSGIGGLIGTIGSVFSNVWRTVNPPTAGQINPQTNMPYGINPATGLPYGQSAFNLGGNGMLLLIGAGLIAAFAFFGKK